MILLANHVREGIVPATNNIIKSSDLAKKSQVSEAGAKYPKAEDTGVTLRLSALGKTAARYEGAVNIEETKNKEGEDNVDNVFARIQKYMNRSLQLENEASDDKITQSERQKIQNEINKITLVVNNLSGASELDATSIMENSISMIGNLVNHSDEFIAESSENIRNHAKDALMAQRTMNHMEVMGLLA